MKLSTLFKNTLNESDTPDEAESLKKKIEDWCKSMKMHGYQVVKEGKDYVINVNGNVRIYANDLPLDDDNMSYFPYQMGEINGDFVIVGNGREKFHSLKNGPITVYGKYIAAYLHLESLEGMASTVSERCDLSNNRLTSWDGIPSMCGDLVIHVNKITSFKGISKNLTMGSYLKCDPMNGGVLELLKVEGLDQVELATWKKHDLPMAKAEEIINKHLQGDRDILDMQSDFIDADLAHLLK